jgi:secondary thiamine-phosphate synthase enzyme
MTAFTGEIELSTKARDDIFDITAEVSKIVSASKIKSGLACVFVPGSTGAVTTLEYEPGLLEDIPRALDRLFPKGIPYGHEERWHDGNGHSHVRAAFLGPSLTVPIIKGRLTLGTWQQIVFIELDNKPRERDLVVQVMGDR